MWLFSVSVSPSCRVLRSEDLFGLKICLCLANCTVANQFCPVLILIVSLACLSSYKSNSICESFSSSEAQTILVSSVVTVYERTMKFQSSTPLLTNHRPEGQSNLISLVEKSLNSRNFVEPVHARTSVLRKELRRSGLFFIYTTVRLPKLRNAHKWSE